MSDHPLSEATLRRLSEAAGLLHWATMPVPQQLDPQRLHTMLADGVGDMQWLARHQNLRLSPQAFWPSARSLLVATHTYQPQPLRADGLQQARYAAGKDYHQIFRKKLARLGRSLMHEAKAQQSCRAVVDSAPVDERVLAQMAGLGWLGKNALLITPRQGSYQFLGVLFSDLLLPHINGGFGDDHCGTCDRCETACPTAALVNRRVLSERCISYLTIEHHGVIERQLAESFEGWWYGCDRCQEVCPWNRFAPEAADGRLTGLVHQRDELYQVNETTFDVFFQGSAVRRIGFARFRRNLVTALFSIGAHQEAIDLAADGPELAYQQAQELGLVT